MIGNLNSCPWFAHVTRRNARVVTRGFTLYLFAAVLFTSIVVGISAQAQQDTMAETQSSGQGLGRWYVASPAVVGFDSGKLNSTIARIGEMSGVQGFLLTRGGYLIEEQYWRGGAHNNPHNLKSASKSIISTLVGIAIAKGYLRLDQPITEVLPQARDLQDPDKKRITVHHLLTMTSGLKSTSYQAYNDWVLNRDWISTLLQRPLTDQPGTIYQYSTGDTHILSAILTETTGMSTRQFAEQELFDPMEVRIAGWQQDPNGIYFGGNNLSLLPRDVIKFGQLYLNRGRWGERQLVPEWWVKEATRETGNGPHETYGNYGYLWWVQPSDQGSFVAVGYGGQYIFVSPLHDTVIVVLSTKDESKGDRWGSQMFELLRDGVLGSLINQAMPPVILASANVTIDAMHSDEPVRAVTVTNLNLRTEPRLNGQRLTTIPKGTQLELTQRKGDWVYGITNGYKGWLHWDYVDQLALVSETVGVVPLQDLAEFDDGVTEETFSAVNVGPSIASEFAPEDHSSNDVDELIVLRFEVAKLAEVVTREQAAKVELGTELERLREEYQAQGQRLEGFRLADETGKTELAVLRSELAEVVTREQAAKVELGTELERLREEYQAQGQRLEGFRLADETGKTELAVLRSELAKLAGELQQERSAKVGLSTDVARLTEEHQVQGQRLEGLVAEAQSRQAELEVSRTQVAKLAEVVTSEQAAKVELGTELERLREVYQAQGQRLEGLVAEAQSRQAELASSRSQVAKLAEVVTREQAAKVELGTELERLSEVYQAQGQRLEGFRLADETGKTELAVLRSELAEVVTREQAAKVELGTELERLREEYQAQGQRLEGFRLADETGKTELAVLRSELAKLAGELQQERSAKVGLSTDVARLTEEHQVQGQRLEGLVAEAQSRQAELEASRTQVAKLAEVVTREQAAKSEMGTELERLREEYQAQGQRLEGFRLADETGKTELAVLRSELARLAGELQQERSAKVGLSTDVARLTEEHQVQGQRLEGLVAEAQSRQAELAASRSQFDNLSLQINSLRDLLDTDTKLPRYRAVARINFRGSPSLSGSWLRTLEPETEFQAMDRQGSWLKVRIDGAEGWIHSDYVHAIESHASITNQEDLTTGLSDLDMSVHKLLDERDMAQQTITNIEGKLEGTQDQILANDAERERLQQEGFSLQKALKDLDAEQTKQRQETSSELAKLAGELQQERSAKVGLSTDVARLTEEHQVQGQRLEGLVAEAQSRQAELEASRTQVAKLAEVVTREQAAKSEMGTELERLREEYQAQGQRLEGLVTEAQSRQAELAASRSQVAMLAEVVTREQATKSEMETELERLREVYQAQGQRLEGFRLADETGKTELAVLRSELAKLAGELQQEQSAKVGLSTDVARLTEEHQAQGQRLEGLVAEAQSRQAELVLVSRLKQELTDARTVRDQTERQLAKLNNSYQEQASIIASNRRQIDALQQVVKHDKQVLEQSARQFAAKTSAQLNAPARRVPRNESVLGSVSESEIDKFVRDWADAWSRQDLEEYLALYTDDFRPADGSSHDAWKNARNRRITRPKFVEVKISDITIETLGASRARVTFRQSYRADHYQDKVDKTLELARARDQWRIVSERAH